MARWWHLLGPPLAAAILAWWCPWRWPDGKCNVLSTGLPALSLTHTMRLSAEQEQLHNGGEGSEAGGSDSSEDSETSDDDTDVYFDAMPWPPGCLMLINLSPGEVEAALLAVLATTAYLGLWRRWLGPIAASAWRRR